MSYQKPILREIDAIAAHASCCTYSTQYPVNGGKYVVNGDCIVPV